jgi:hypothetical protein
VENGTQAVVRAVDVERREVELELEEPLKKGADGKRPPPRRVWVGPDVELELGYARHVYKAQGKTVDTADMAVSLRTHLNELYVMVSRAREGVRVHALAAELEEIAVYEAEVLAELELDEPDGRKQLALENVKAWDAERRREAEEQRRVATEKVTIEEIERHAKPSTKEAVGDRPIGQAEEMASPVRKEDGARRERIPWYDLERQDHLSPRPAELPLPPREPDLPSIVLADGRVVERGQVVRFTKPEALPGAAANEVQPDDIGVVLGYHRGGVTYPFATVELVGGRRVELWQTGEGVDVEPDLPPSVVLQAVPRPDQRDPASLGVLELRNGARLGRGDRVRLTEAATLDGVGQVEAGTLARVSDVQRHQHNRAIVELDDGRRASVYSAAPLEIVRPAREPCLGPGAPGAAEDLVLPAHDPRETLAREYMATPDTSRALAQLQLAGRVEYAEDPMARAIERLEADREAVLVVERALQQRALEELGKREELEADVRERGRLVIAEEAHQQRVEHRAGIEVGLREREEAGDLTTKEVAERLTRQDREVEEDVPIGRAIVVTEEPWASAELTRSLSVAGESHLVSVPPSPMIQRETAAIIEQHRQAELEAGQGAEQLELSPAGYREPQPEAERHGAEQSDRVRNLARQNTLEAEIAAGHEAQRGEAEMEAEPGGPGY